MRGLPLCRGGRRVRPSFGLHSARGGLVGQRWARGDCKGRRDFFGVVEDVHGVVVVFWHE
eukprot:4737127-Prymnesium_polylepis.1